MIPIRIITCQECDGLGEWDEGPINTRGSPCIPEDPIYRQVICPECSGNGVLYEDDEGEDS